jgi:ABC-type polysaccharide/polyol phosphate export permease
MPGRYVATEKPASSFWDLLLAVTVRDLQVRYHGTFLSYFWWIARPLALGLVLYFALNKVLALDVDNHAAFLLSALFPWFWFQGALFASTGAFVSNAGLIKKVRFPRIILPLSLVLGTGFEFVVTLPILAGILMVTGIDPDWTWLVGVPALIALQLGLLCGLGILVATLNVYVRDITPGINALLMLLFYVTPILYPLEQVPDGYRQLLMLNPLTPLIEAWRTLFMEGDLPGGDIWPAALFAGVSLAAGAWVLRATGRNMADAL